MAKTDVVQVWHPDDVKEPCEGACRKLKYDGPGFNALARGISGFPLAGLWFQTSLTW